MKKHYPLIFVVLAIFAIVIGCGGGGGGGGCTGADCGGTGGTYTVIRLVGVSGGNFVDPQNLSPGQSVQLELVGFDKTNKMTVLGASGWTTTAPSSVATVSGSGVLNAIAANPNTFNVSATYSGRSYSSALGVHNNIAYVTGNVRTASGAAVAGAYVLFFDAPPFTSGAHIVGRTLVNQDGSFRAQVVTTAQSFALDTVANLTNYYNIFNYNGSDYTLATTGCYAPLPNLTTGQTVSLSSDIIATPKKAGGPPPPPPGCFP